MTDADPDHERLDPTNRRHESMRLAFNYFVLGWIIISAIIVGFIILYYALSSEPERLRFFDFIYAHPPAVLGIQSRSRLSEQIFRIDKWSLRQGYAAMRSGSVVK